MQLITVCNRYTPELTRLFNSAKLNGHRLQVLGMGRSFTCNSDKFVYVKEWAEHRPDEEVVMFVDAFDTIVMATEQEMLRKFADFNVELVVSGELNCWPNKELAPYFNELSGPYKYINSGCWIGYAGYVASLLGTYNLHASAMQDDQALWTSSYLNDRQLYLIDSCAVLFQSMYDVGNEVQYDAAKQRVYNSITGTKPCVIHGNGRSNLVPGIEYLTARGNQCHKQA